jgi:hypothetical protein
VRKTVFVVCFALFAFTIALAQDSFIDEWQKRATESQAEQPHWVTPVAVTTPRLEQEIRYDLMWRTQEDGTTLANYGGGKGLELIPTRRTEIIIGIPPDITHENASHDGWGDMSFLLKYRVTSRNEEKGNYIVTMFLGATVPTGSYSNGARDAVVTPTIAVGKGWHKFDVQSTFGVGIPTAGAATFGHPIAWNTAFQYRLMKRVWPEIEVNSTFWNDGTNAGNKEVFLTPGLVFGRFPIHNRLGFTFGGGVQIAATRFHRFNHNGILTLRMPF